MVFKNKLFFSSKKSDTSSPDGSNSSPRSIGSNSPIGSDKKKQKAKDSAGASSAASPVAGAGRKAPVREFLVKKKEAAKGKEKEKEKVKEKEKEKEKEPSVVVVQGRAKPKVPDGKAEAAAASAVAASPLLASSLGLNKIKTRSGPLPQESFFGFRGEKGSGLLGSSNLSRHGGGGGGLGSGSGKKKDVDAGAWKGSLGDNGGASPAIPLSREASPSVHARTRLQNGESSTDAAGRPDSMSCSGGLSSSDACTPEAYDCDNPKESESPRFQAILRLTSAPGKRFPADVKSFSHELNSKGVRPFPFWKPRGRNNLQEVLVVIRTKFDKAKEEVNSDLAVFAADVVGILEKNAESQPEWQETLEDLLVLARSCAMTSPGEFWLQCEGIVQELDDRRQELPPGMLKQLHTRMLFILTRCTRLLQFHKESGLAEEDNVFHLPQTRVLHSADKRLPPSLVRDEKSASAVKPKPSAVRMSYSQDQRGLDWSRDNMFQQESIYSPSDSASRKSASAVNPKPPAVRMSYSQDQRGLDWNRDLMFQPENVYPPSDSASSNIASPSSRDRIASWKKLPSPPAKSLKEFAVVKEQVDDSKFEYLKTSSIPKGNYDVEPIAPMPSELPAAKDFHEHSAKHQHKASWGYWGDNQSVAYDNSIICRICEEEVQTLHVEDHSRICAISDRCDQKGLSVNERLTRIAEALEKMIDPSSQKDIPPAVESPDPGKVSNSSVTEESDAFSPKLSDWSRRGSEDMLDCFPEADNAVFMDELKGLPSMSCRTRFGPKSDQGMATSSAGSMTPRSPLLTPRTSQIDLLLAGKGTYSEHDDHPQMTELVDIARCVANTPLEDDRSMPYLLSCLEDLRVVIERRKFDALTVETFGTRIEKLIREKYLQLCELVDDEKVDIARTVIDEDAPLEDDVVRSLRTSPNHSSKDRTSIDDFEIMKPISRGAFGRVFLAKKRTTGDLFAIKVLKKADMIRKNAVESILAERDILISVRNPFVVRFFYSFTCRENLYLVMEYLNGGDLYSLLRNMGCLDEDVARVYIAELVLALEYLHSLRVVHRDIKPDNLLIAHDGHIKLTDFGLSKVGLINSTDDLSGPAVSGTSMLVDDEPQLPTSEHQRELRKKRSAVGTPDYLAPEILLGTGHGTTADWWSVGVLLFEMIVGIPPFNAEHPQIIFDNILNRNIPWPKVPEDMSYEAHDLIDRLLTEDPHQRLGAGGASEVKQHVFFKNINWDTLARQKAAFVPSSESAFDTSYFTSRYSWGPSQDRAYTPSESEYSSDADSLSRSSSGESNRQDEVVNECAVTTELESASNVDYSFSNFSFKNLSQLASINYDLLSKGWKDDPGANSGS